MNYNDITNELSQNFIEYAVAVNSDRAIPDSKSGLKPVAKRILWSAFEEKRFSNKPHVKSARIVGDVMGKYHPHGDSSIYGAMVRLAQPWVMRYPIIDWHGSCGNQDGDGAAAMRYTEARLSSLAEDGLLQNIKKSNVDFIDNFDETLLEPVTLPALFPNLLCNPNSGIGVSMACNWLPHNLKEVAQAIYDTLDGKEPTLPGPDFPTGGVIINKNDIPTIMKTGHGSVKVRGKYHTEQDKLIVFDEIPYNVTTEALLENIGKACEEKKIENVIEIRNESNKKGFRLVIECTKGTNLEAIARKLFAYTNLQTSISYNQVALVDKTPTELNLKDCIEIYINHNIECLVKEIQFDKTAAEKRLEIVVGLLKALEDIDNVIALIKKSDSPKDAKVSLIKKYELSDAQAQAILNMKLSSLARLQKLDLQKEKEELEAKIIYFNSILDNEEKQKDIIRERLEKLVKKYGDDRKTELLQISTPSDSDAEIETVIPEDVVVIVSQGGSVKRIPVNSFKVQKRRGKGVKNKDDAILDAHSSSTIDTLLVFTTKGKMYKILVDNIPAGTAASKGVQIGNLISLDPDEKVIKTTTLKRKTTAESAIFITKNGMLKKTALSEYTKTKKTTGIVALKLKEDDTLLTVTFVNDEDIIFLSKKGKILRVRTSNIKQIGRNTLGIKAMNLNEGDYVVNAIPIASDTTEDLAIFTKDGFAYRTKISDIAVQGKGGKGRNCASAELAGALKVEDSDTILAIGLPNSITIKAEEIKQGNLGIKGVKIINNSELNYVLKI